MVSISVLFSVVKVESTYALIQLLYLLLKGGMGVTCRHFAGHHHSVAQKQRGSDCADRCGQPLGLAVDSNIAPAATSSGTIILQISKTTHRFTIGDRPAIDIYCQDFGSYSPFWASQVLNKPSRSSVSRNDAATMAVSFV